jgi:hypothetical protein
VRDQSAVNRQHRTDPETCPLDGITKIPLRRFLSKAPRLPIGWSRRTSFMASGNLSF